MASYDVLRDIVRNGSDLVLTTGINYDVLRELAELAAQSGSRLSVPTSMNYDVVRELSATYGKKITFINGLSSFEKPGK
jgi:hypothetical protein